MANPTRKLRPIPHRHITQAEADRLLSPQRATNLMTHAARIAFRDGYTTPEAIRTQGLSVLQELASSCPDTRVRAQAAIALATLGSAEQRTTRPRRDEEQELLESLSDDELQRLVGLVAQAKGNTPPPGSSALPGAPTAQDGPALDVGDGGDELAHEPPEPCADTEFSPPSSEHHE